jgi:hypothetical protein
MPAGPGVQTFQLGDNTVSIAFSQLTVSAAVASPDAYTVQHVSVTDSAPLGFHSTISGDWQYNGTYAYVWGAAPSCSSNLAVVLNCSNLNNGVSMPYPMVWIDEGYDVADGGSTYQIEIDLYGNGVHEVYVTGP